MIRTETWRHTEQVFFALTEDHGYCSPHPVLLWGSSSAGWGSQPYAPHALVSAPTSDSAAHSTQSQDDVEHGEGGLPDLGTHKRHQALGADPDHPQQAAWHQTLPQLLPLVHLTNRYYLMTKYSLYWLKSMAIAHLILWCCETPPLLGEVANPKLISRAIWLV